MFQRRPAEQRGNGLNVPVMIRVAAPRLCAVRIVASATLALCFLASVPALAATPCCRVTGIAANGQVTAREINGTRTVLFQLTDPALLRGLKPGAPVYANFDTKQVSLDGRKACCRITQTSTAALPPAPKTTPAAPKVPPVPARQQAPASPATVAGAAAQTQVASSLIVTLEAVLTDATLRKSHSGVTGGQEASAAVRLTGPARAVQYGQAGRGMREGPPMVLLTSSDPGVLGVPDGVPVPIGEREGRFTFITNAVAQPKDVTITATFSNVSKTGTVRIVPSQLLRIETPTPVRGGHVVQGRVVLNGPPANAASGTVKLASDNAQLVRLPNTVTVPTGQTQASFDIETFGVADDQTAMLAATHGEQGPRTASLTLLPPIVAEFDAGQESGSSWCVGPCTRSLRVSLDGKAPADGLRLTLTSELPVHIPASVTVPAGATEVSVPITATQVTSNTSATLSASYGASKKRVDFKVFRLEKHDLYVRRAPKIVDRFGNVVASPPDSQGFRMCVNVATKRIPFHTSGLPSPTALGVTYRIGSTGRSFQVPVAWDGSVLIHPDDGDVIFVPTCFDLPGIADGGAMDVETIADLRKELDESDEGNNDRSFKIER